MNVPYSAVDLDNLLKACIEFTAHNDTHFYTGNICGRDGVTTDIDSV